MGATIQRKMFLLLNGRLHVSNKGQPSRSLYSVVHVNVLNLRSKFKVYHTGLLRTLGQSVSQTGTM